VSAVRSRLACAAAWTALAAAPAAAVPGDPFDLRSACREDFERLCRDLGSEAPRAAIERCLASHERELSPACRIAVGEETEPDDADDPVGTAPRPRN
jgi:hypothetical protein